MRAINGLSLCAGIGGIDLGLGLALRDYRTVCYVEREAHAAATLVAGMEVSALDQAPIWDDLKAFDGSPWRGIVDIVTAGYPCQPFSHAGKRGGDTDERHLWPDVARIVSEVSPRWCFFENVGGHLSLGFEEVVSDLERMDYRVAAGLFRASDVGAPHRRERLFVLADCDGTGAQGSREPKSRQVHSERGSGEQLADAESNLHARKREAQGRPRDSITDGCYPLVDPEDPTGRRSGGAAISRKPAEAGGPDPFPPGPAEDWSGLADSEGGDGAMRLRDIQQGEREHRGGGQRVYGTPVPRDLWPALPKSEIRGVADGIASRVDRLRACGNAVVPHVAAFSFITLAGVLEYGDPLPEQVRMF